MTKFSVTTVVIAAGVLAALLILEGAARIWAAAALVGLWIALMVAGVSFIKWGFFGPVVCRGHAAGDKAAITFDDGPDERTTPAVLDELGRLGVKAAFFCVGEKVARCPALARRIVDEGHIIGNHSSGHRWYTNFLFGGGLRREIGSAQNAIFEAAGHRPRFYRPPMGLTNPHVEGALRRLGMTAVGWDVGAFDRKAQPEEVVARVSKRVRSGSIVLLHDAGSDAESLVRVLTGVVEEIQRKGLQLVRLDDMLGMAPWQEDGQ